MIASLENKPKPLNENRVEMVRDKSFKPKKIKQGVLKNFDKNTDNIDLEDLFKPAE